MAKKGYKYNFKLVVGSFADETNAIEKSLSPETERKGGRTFVTTR
jgi:hypothetical protein